VLTFVKSHFLLKDRLGLMFVLLWENVMIQRINANIDTA